MFFSFWAVVGIGNKVVWAGGGMGRGHQTDSALPVGLCAEFVGRRMGWVGMIGYQMLL